MAEYRKKPFKLSVLQDAQIVRDESPCIYNVSLKQVVQDNEGLIKKLEFGDKIKNDVGKVIMMVGQTGSGKTTLINGLINYVFGVEWDDPFRFKMILEGSNANQAESQTKDITSYHLHHQDGFQIPYSLTVIDTPGFGDTQGVERDREIVEQIRKFFSTPGEAGISHIDAVGFVIQASQPRLSPVQRYIFDNILSLFGKDVKDNIFLLITFADGPKPQVLSAVNEAELPFKKQFIFNNGALYSQTSDNEGYQYWDSHLWKMASENFKMFLKELLFVESQSLVLTKDVLEERKRIEVYVEGIQKNIQVGLSKMNTLNEEEKLLEKYEDDADKNKNYRLEIEEDVFCKKELEGNRNMNNCQKCERTCHRDCMCWNNSLLYLCRAMYWNGTCKICPSNCNSSDHKLGSFMYDVKRVKTHKTVDEILHRYQSAQEKKLSTQNVVDKIKAEYNLLQENILRLTDSMRKSLKRLNEIALKPWPMTTVEYIDLLIQNEKGQANPGWLERVEQLTKLREREEYIKGVATENSETSPETSGNSSDHSQGNDMLVQNQKRQAKQGWFEKMRHFLQPR